MSVSCTAYGESVQAMAESLRAASDAGFAAVDLVVEQDLDKGELARAVRESAIQVSGLRLCGAVGVDRAADEVRLNWAAELCRELDLSSVVVVAGPRKGQSVAAFVDGLEELLAIADGTGIGIEVMNREGSRIEQLDDLREMHIRLMHPRLRLAMHTGEFHRASVNPCDLVREWGHRLGRVYLEDVVGRQTVGLGAGEVNIPAVVGACRQAGLDAWLVVDSPMTGGRPAAEQLRAMREYVESLQV